MVDKTLLIKDLLDIGGKVTLFTRPRRFGKTLNMSMLKRYFEKTDEDNSYLFDGLKISEAGEKYPLPFTGLRVCELCGLKWEDIDFSNAIFRRYIA